MSRIIQLTRQVPPELVATLKGEHLDERHYGQVLGGEPLTVMKPDGTLLGILVPGALPKEVCEAAYPALYRFGRQASDRGRKRGFRTAIVGWYQSKLEPVPDLTTVTCENLGSWYSVRPYIVECNRVYAKHDKQLGGRHSIQRRAAASNKYHIGDTAFSTMAVNLWDVAQDGRSPAHPDDRDLPGSFAVISVARRHAYTGGYLVFPRFRVAFDLRETDVLLYDPLQMHGNAPVIGQPGWQRISTVLFYLAALQQPAT
jgi:hypothetical protein